MEEERPILKRTKPTNGQVLLTNQQLQTLMSVIVARSTLASALGRQYGGDRDMMEALGYKLEITYQDMLARYERQDIAKAIIDRPVRATWQGQLELIETDDEKTTLFEQAWLDLEEDLGIKSRFARVDRLTGIGEYGVLLLGLDDVRNKEDYAKPATGTRKLKYLKPFGQENAQIQTYESKSASPRYGMPLIYQINISDVGTGVSTSLQVHYTRVVHITDEPLESEIRGEPRLKVVFDRLMDLEKLIGGSAEMFWRGARGGYLGKVGEKFQLTKKVEEDLKAQLDEYEHNLRRVLVSEGLDDMKSLEQSVSSPKDHVDVVIQMISAVTGIPKRILTGSERGELSSDQDKNEWLTYVKTRREEHAEPRIIRPFVDRCIELRILPEPTERYSVKWEDLFSVSEKEKVEIGKGRAEALAKYTASPMAEAVMPPAAFMEFCLGFTKDQIEVITEMVKAQQAEEEARLAEMTPEERMLEEGIIPPGQPQLGQQGTKPTE